MAYNMLTTDGVNSFISDWQANETKKKIDPLTTKKQKWTDLEEAYTTIGEKLTTLKSNLYSLQLTGTSSAFLAKKASSSDTTFVDITATSAAALSTQSIRVDQLAKNDLVISQDLTSTADSATFTVPGIHTFTVTAGDGKGGVLTSNVEVEFTVDDFTGGVISNANVIAKIQDALTTNTATVNSVAVGGSTASAGSFNLTLNGTATQINYSAGTYSDVLDSVVTQINQINGVNAQKIDNGGTYELRITVTDSSKYISIDGDTSGLLSELSVSASQLMGSSGLVTASTFNPTSDLSQLSIAAKKSGNDYRILSLTDTNGGQVLTSLGLNLGASRQSFVQNTSGADTPGFVYTTDLLNAKFKFNGIDVERSSNNISDLISGATVNLKSLMQPTDTDVTLSIASDTESVINKIQDFIKNFDDLYVYLKEKTRSTEEGRGILIGDSTASSLMNLFTNVSTSAVAGISTTVINSLSELGISFSVTDGLSVSDAARLEKAIKEQPDQVEAVFNSTSGVAKTLYNAVNPYVNATGYIYQSKKNFDTTITYLDDKIKSLTERIEKSASDKRLQYLRTMSQMKALLSNQSMFIMGSSSSFYGG